MMGAVIGTLQAKNVMAERPRAKRTIIDNAQVIHMRLQNENFSSLLLEIHELRSMPAPVV